MVAFPQNCICPISMIELYCLGCTLSFRNVFISKPQSRFHPAPPIGTEPHRPGMSYSISASSGSEKSVSSNIMTTGTGDTGTCAAAKVSMAVNRHIVSWPPMCDLVSSLTWEKYQHEKQKHTADTDIHLLATLPSAVQKK